MPNPHGFEPLEGSLCRIGLPCTLSLLLNAVQISLAKTTWVGRGQVSISMPRQDHLRVLANWLKVSPDQLRFGRSEANTTIFKGYEVSIEDQEFLAKYFSLTSTQKSIVRSVANFPIWLLMWMVGNHKCWRKYITSPPAMLLLLERN